MSKLALFGGPQSVQLPLSPFVRIGDGERREVEKVLASGELSGFVGAMCDEYRGGRAVRTLEDAWAERFGCKYAVSVNSNTSGLVSVVLLAPTMPILVVSILMVRPSTALMFVPSLSQHLLLLGLIKNEPVNSLHVIVSVGGTLLIGALLTWICARLYRREGLLG